jgi:hypothetical protein
MDSYGLAVADVQQSHFAIVRFNIDLVERHNGHQRRTGAHVVADLDGPLTHQTVDRSPNPRIGQIKLGLFKLSLIGLDRRSAADRWALSTSNCRRAAASPHGLFRALRLRARFPQCADSCSAFTS